MVYYPRDAIRNVLALANEISVNATLEELCIGMLNKDLIPLLSHEIATCKTIKSLEIANIRLNKSEAIKHLMAALSHNTSIVSLGMI